MKLNKSPMRSIYFGLFGLLLIILASCGNPKELHYFQGEFDTAKLSQIQFEQPKIQIGDILSIRVYSDNKEASEAYNLPFVVGQQSTGGSAGSTSGYLVDMEGNIQVAGVGSIHVAGINISQLRDSLDARLSKLLMNPYYNIRFANYKVTIIGDVKSPGTFNFPVEKVTIVEALGMAGDLTMYGKRDNILIIREHNGQREFGRVDLLKPDLFSSKWYYLQQNDVVYVDMFDKKAVTTDQTMRYVAITTSLLSIASIIIALTSK